jgi:hypothetical protein
VAGGKPRKLTVNTVLVILVILGPVIGAVWAIANANAAPPARKAAPAGSSSQPPAVEAPLTWTSAQALAALGTQVIARLPGAPAVLDEDKIRGELEAKGERALLLPFSGVDTRKQHQDEIEKVTNAYAQPGKLIIVSGLTVELVNSGLTAVPDSMPELTAIMSGYDVTDLVSTAIANTKKPSTTPLAAPEPVPTVPADPAQVDLIARSLAANELYTAPGLPAAIRDARWNRAGPGRTVRIAVLPPLASGAKTPELASALAARFPGDLVAVAFGEWVDFAGPDPDVQRTAVTAYYSAHYEQLAEWGPDPLALALALTGEITDQRTRRAAALVTPGSDVDPLSVVGSALPWVFAGSVVLVAGTGLLVRRRAALRRAGRKRDDRVARGRLAAELTAVAAGIAHLDDLAKGGKAAQLLTSASERYQVARDLVIDEGDLPTARAALTEASSQVAAAAKLLGVPMDPEPAR